MDIPFFPVREQTQTTIVTNASTKASNQPRRLKRKLEVLHSESSDSEEGDGSGEDDNEEEILLKVRQSYLRFQHFIHSLKEVSEVNNLKKKAITDLGFEGLIPLIHFFFFFEK